MDYRVFLIEKRFYEWKIHADSQEEAEYLAKKFFALSDERLEHFIGDEIMVWSFVEKE